MNTMTVCGNSFWTISVVKGESKTVNENLCHQCLKLVIETLFLGTGWICEQKKILTLSLKLTENDQEFNSY